MTLTVSTVCTPSDKLSRALSLLKTECSTGEHPPCALNLFQLLIFSSKTPSALHCSIASLVGATDQADAESNRVNKMIKIGMKFFFAVITIISFP